MKFKIKEKIVCFIGLSIWFSACRFDDEGMDCTFDFRIVMLEVEGPTLSDYFTIRESTVDTLQLN